MKTFTVIFLAAVFPTFFSHNGQVTGCPSFYSEATHDVSRGIGGLLVFNPRALIDFECFAAQLKSKEDAKKATQAKYYAASNDPVLMLGKSKLRFTVAGFISVSLIIFGACLLSYGERVWDFAHEVGWWGGYVCLVIAGFILFGLGVSSVAQFMHL